MPFVGVLLKVSNLTKFLLSHLLIPGSVNQSKICIYKNFAENGALDNTANNQIEAKS